MPAPRLPSNVHALTGAFDAHPERARDRADEPEPETIDIRSVPVPPSLTELEAITWRRTAEVMHENVMTRPDVDMLVVYVRLMTLALYEPEIDVKVAAQLRSYSALFGLTPADRSRVKVVGGKKPKADPDGEFFAA